MEVQFVLEIHNLLVIKAIPILNSQKNAYKYVEMAKI